MLTYKVENDKLIVEIDISEAAFRKAEPSKTGKTKLVASTRGSVRVETKHGPVSLALNLMAGR